MMTALSSSGDRLRGGAIAFAVTAMLGAGLIWGLAVRVGAPDTSETSVFSLTVPTPEPVRVERAPQRDRRASGRAAPPNLKSRATQVAAPPPIIPVRVDPPIIVAETPATAQDRTSGAAPVSGPGTGAGGIGDGFGAGGDGDGDGAGDRDHTPPRLIRGRIRDADYPDDLADAGVGGRVGVRYRVEIDGRVSQCQVIASSGIARLDALTCRLIRDRFRFRPSRDGRGQPVPATIEENHEWMFEAMAPRD